MGECVNLLRRLWGGAASRARLPLSATLDLDDRGVSADPFPWYERLRAEGDAVYLARHDFWLVLGYEPAREIFARPDLFSSSPYTYVDTAMLSVDPPLHGPVRRVVGRAFGGETLRRLETEAAGLADSFIRSELEIMADFARPLSRRVAASLIGFDDLALEAIARAEEESIESGDHFQQLCLAIDSVAGRAKLMETLQADGAGLISPDDARSLVRLLWLASTATTERTIGQCVLRLLESPALNDRLRSEPRLVPAFVEEVLRLAPPENLIQRRAVAPASIAGAEIPAGASVQICLPAANRDPARYDSPAELRLDRGGSGNLSFGSGIHQCVGGPMTRRVVNAAITRFIARSADLRPAPCKVDVTWVHAMMIRAPSELWVAL